MFLVTACQRAPESVAFQAVDLTRTLGAAEHRPSAGFDLTAHVADGVARPSIVMPVPARAIWSMPLPRHGLFHAFVAIDTTGAPPAPAAPAKASTAVRFRLGISDARVYEELTDRTVTAPSSSTAGAPGWTELRADLSPYAGIKWSLFYRPDRITWRLVLATDAVGGGPVRAVWGSPEILTDMASAQEYEVRRRRVLR
jgi:hypothetical protein